MRSPQREDASTVESAQKSTGAPSRGLGGSLEVASLLPFLVVFVAPLAFYLGNRDELYFGLGEVLPGAFGVFVMATLALLPVVLLAGRWRASDRLVSGALVGLAAAAWVQAQIFVWDFGPLDGRGIEWSRWQSSMRVELAAWVLLPALAVLLARRGARLLGQGVALADALSLGVAFWTAPEPS